MQGKKALIAILLAGLFVGYWNSFPGEFHYDDYALFLDDPRFTSEPFRWASFLDHYGGRPLTLLSLHANFRFFGESPEPYHWVSVLLHALAVIGLFLLVTELQEHRIIAVEGVPADSKPVPTTAFLTALIFALHPLQSQAVNYIWSRSMLLMAVLVIGTLLLLLRDHPWAALIVFQLAIWSRVEALAALPFLLAVMRPRGRRAFLGMAAVNATVLVVSIWAYSHPRIGWQLPDWTGYYMTQPAAFWEYLRLMAWPSDLHLDRHLAISTLWSALLGLAALVLLACAAWRWRQRCLPAALGLSWIAAWLAPAMLLPNGDLINESRSYLALAGFALAVVWIGQSLFEAGRRTLAGSRFSGTRFPLFPATAALLFTFACLGPLWQRNLLWNDDIALYRDAAVKSPDKARVRYNLGSALARSGDPAAAEKEFRKALELSPDDLSMSAVGYCAEVQNRPDEALRYYRRALKLNPNNQRAVSGLARLSSDEDRS